MLLSRSSSHRMGWKRPRQIHHCTALGAALEQPKRQARASFANHIPDHSCLNTESDITSDAGKFLLLVKGEDFRGSYAHESDCGPEPTYRDVRNESEMRSITDMARLRFDR